jgi:hypothetical protein
MRKFCGICFDRLLLVVGAIAIPIIIIWAIVDFVKGASLQRQRTIELNKLIR